MKKYIFILLVLAGLAGCIKPPQYPVEPHIEFKSVSSSYIKSGYVDTITVSFTDGDGDLGAIANAADSCDVCSLKHGDSRCLHLSSFNVFLIDNRDTCMNNFASADIVTTGKYDDISGEIQIITTVNSKTCFAVPNPNCPIDSVKYAIIVKDKAGHLSNTVHASNITVDPH